MIFPEVRSKDLKSGDVLACLLLDATEGIENKNGKLEQDIHIDYNGATHGAIFYPGNSPELTPDDFNKYFYFKFWRFDRGSKAWIRCVLDSPEPIAKSEIAKQRRTAPQHQTARPAKRETPSQSPEQPDWDAKDQRMVNMNGLNNAILLLTTIAETSGIKDWEGGTESIEKIATEFVRWIYTHKHQTKEEQLAGELVEPEGYASNPEYVGDNPPPPTEDDIPF